jgi:hypothetical protein
MNGMTADRHRVTLTDALREGSDQELEDALRSAVGMHDLRAVPAGYHPPLPLFAALMTGIVRRLDAGGDVLVLARAAGLCARAYSISVVVAAIDALPLPLSPNAELVAAMVAHRVSVPYVPEEKRLVLQRLPHGMPDGLDGWDVTTARRDVLVRLSGDGKPLVFTRLGPNDMTRWMYVLECRRHSEARLRAFVRWARVRALVRVLRPYALYWQETVVAAHCAPGGKGRAADCAAYEAE